MEHTQRPGAPPILAGLLISAAALLLMGALDSRANAQEVPSPSVVPVAAPADLSPGRLLVTLPWGDGPGEAGLLEPQEGLARGPEAMAATEDGRLVVLDSVNRRLLLLAADGEPQGTIPVTLSEPRFLALTKEAIYVADVHGDARLLGLAWTGQTILDVPLPPLEDPPTYLQARQGKLFLEILHDKVFELRLRGADRPPLLVPARGRALGGPGNRQAQVRFERGAQPLLETIDPESKTSAKSTLDFEREIEALVSLDGDDQGRLILGARLEPHSAASPGAAGLLLTRFSAPGQPTQSLLLQQEEHYAYLGEPYSAGPRGEIYQPKAGPEGYSIFVHNFGEGVVR